MQKLDKGILIAISLLIPILVLLAIFLLFGDNINVIRQAFDGELSADEIRSVLSQLGFRGWATVSILAMLQVVMMILPAEPIQVIGGLSFGFKIGFLLCLVGVVAGNVLIYILYMMLGERLRNYFDKNLNIDFKSVGNSFRITVAVFILYFLPSIPYGMIAFLAAAAGMNFLRFLFITTIGVIPSICIGVGLGHIALENSIFVTLAVFAVLVLLLTFVMIKRNVLISRVNDYINDKERNKFKVKEYSPRKLDLPYFIFRILTFRKVKFKILETVEKIERPSIVLCNHGAFIDFAYAGTVLKKESPNFIVNRLYFYEKHFAWLLRSFGCFPKSIFTVDTESAINCVRVIKCGGVLAMMPEARLTTVGKFEDIQNSTFDFLKKVGVHVYVIKLSGDYLAKPKWGKGLRRGSLVEARMSPLFTPEELFSLDVTEIKERTENALRYDELKWLDGHPEINYRSRRIAEGLENILTLCPECGAKYSFVTKRNTLSCTHCNTVCKVNSRYAFEDTKPFSNFVEWYEWQFNKMSDEVFSDPNFELRSEVTLKHASKTGKKRLENVGTGVCTLSREGLVYEGTEYGENVRKVFSLQSIYRLLFGAGVDFEFYSGKDIYFFVPKEKRSCVDWYMASIILSDASVHS